MLSQQSFAVLVPLLNFSHFFQPFAVVWHINADAHAPVEYAKRYGKTVRWNRGIFGFRCQQLKSKDLKIPAF